jgi:hypothetical protein
MLRIFTFVKIQQLRPGLNPRPWVPEAFRGMYCLYLQVVWIMCQLCRKAGQMFWPIGAMKPPLSLYKSSSIFWLKFPATFPYNWHICLFQLLMHLNVIHSPWWWSMFFCSMGHTLTTQCGPKFPGLNFFTTFLATPSTGPWLNYVVETISHKSANWFYCSCSCC